MNAKCEIKSVFLPQSYGMMISSMRQLAMNPGRSELSRPYFELEEEE